MAIVNPAFGRWAGDDDPADIYGGTEAADPRAEMDFDEMLERVSREQGSPPRGGPEMPFDPYARPFKRKEARKLLESAGIRHEGIIGAYLAGRADMSDPETGQGPARGQCVVARIRAEDGLLCNVHLYFVFLDSEEQKGWRLHKAALEK